MTENDKQSQGENRIASSGLGKSISSGLSGEDVSLKGVLDAIGGVRGIIEALLPGLLFVIIFIVTNDARVSVIAPAVLALLTVVLRLFSKQTLITALSGVFGVGIAVAATLFSGKGEDYFVPGFWINGIWIIALTISLVLRWPILGFLVGMLRNDMVGWRKDPEIYGAAKLSSLVWLALFVLRLAVQLPMYFAGNVAALGVARLAMGTPLFALVILFTWLLFRKTLSPDKSQTS